MISTGRHVGGNTLSFVFAFFLQGILLPSNMAAITTFCLYLVKRWTVTLRCAENVTSSSFQKFRLSLSAKFCSERGNS